MTVDEARLLPRFREAVDRSDMERAQAQVLVGEVAAAHAAGRDARRPEQSLEHEHASLRGIPAIGRGVAGATRGSSPHGWAESQDGPITAVFA